MKLLFVTCIREDQPVTATIFEKAGIRVFSVMEAIGHKTGLQEELIDSWFASGAERFDSVVLFSFTEPKIADSVMQLIRAANNESASNFPIRAFLMPVEQTV